MKGHGIRSNRIKYEILFLMAMFVLTAGVSLRTDQTTLPIIENPDKPAAQNAGRVLALKEILRIDDEGAGFFSRSLYPSMQRPTVRFSSRTG